MLDENPIFAFVKSLVEEGYFSCSENYTKKSMSANDYFQYCKIAYIAAQRKEDNLDESLSGRKMYERYADDRHNGLLDIPSNSKNDFADWIDGKHPKKSIGGHPWEIKHGGNTTHIDLFVICPRFQLKDNKENFEIMIRAGAIHRLREAICMFLAIHEAGLPITICNAEGIRKRLLALDNIGIIPEYESLHRGNQRFHEHEDVFDVLYLRDLGRYKCRIKPFITWEPLPLLKPK